MSMHKSGRNDIKTPGASVTQDKTLADYMDRKGLFTKAPHNDDHRFPKKKLSFAAWYMKKLESDFSNVYRHNRVLLEAVWKAAQENV